MPTESRCSREVEPVELGPHQSLMATDGKYREMVLLQTAATLNSINQGFETERRG